MRGSVSSLAVRNNLFVRADAEFFIHRLELCGGLESAVFVQVPRPFEMHGTGNSPASRRPNVPPHVLILAAGIEDGDFVFTERVQHVIDRGQHLPSLPYFELSRLRRCRLGGGRQLSLPPCLDPPIKETHVWMTEIFQEPEAPSGSHAGVFLVEDHLFLLANAAQLEEMVNHEHESLEGGGTRVNEAETKEIKMDGSANMSLRKLLCRPCIYEAEDGVIELLI